MSEHKELYASLRRAMRQQNMLSLAAKIMREQHKKLKGGAA